MIKMVSKEFKELQNLCQHALTIVASNDEDYARERNHIGFSKPDVIRGHTLSESEHIWSEYEMQTALHLTYKYRGQIPAFLIAKIVEAKKAYREKKLNPSEIEVLNVDMKKEIPPPEPEPEPASEKDLYAITESEDHKYLTAFDPNFKARTLFKIKNGVAYSLISEYSFEYPPKTKLP